MEKIDTLYNKWQELQPLKQEDQKRLDRKFMLEFNYNSNHIEGNTLTYGQTKLLLMFGETTGSAPLKDYEEMKAHNVGLEMIKQYAKESERPLTESFIRELNKVILVNNYWVDAKTPDGQPTRMEVKIGEYKSRPNSVVTATGETFEYAKPEETPALMTDLVRWFSEEVEKGELTALELATLFHYRYIRIHPFEDGNGRISRLLVNYILHKFDYPMIIIKSEDKANYLRALRKSDSNCGLLPSDGASATLVNIEPFLEYMKQQLEYSLDISIRAASGESIEESGDWQKKLKLKMQSLKETPMFSDEVAKEVAEKSMYSLAKEIDSTFNEYESLFTNKELYIGTENDSDYATIEISDIIPEFDYSSDWDLLLSYTKTNKDIDIALNFYISCYFNERDYKIELTILEEENGGELEKGNLSLTKKYNEFITDEDTSIILDFTGNHFYDFVSSKIIKD